MIEFDGLNRVTAGRRARAAFALVERPPARVGDGVPNGFLARLAFPFAWKG